SPELLWRKPVAHFLFQIREDPSDPPDPRSIPVNCPGACSNQNSKQSRTPAVQLRHIHRRRDCPFAQICARIANTAEQLHPTNGAKLLDLANKGLEKCSYPPTREVDWQRASGTLLAWLLFVFS